MPQTEGQLVSPIGARRGDVATARAFNQTAGIPTGAHESTRTGRETVTPGEDLPHRFRSVRPDLGDLSH
jgi:hypothetical protein